MDYSDICEMRETEDINEADDLVAENWILVNTASGQKPDGSAYFLYCLGKIYTENYEDY